MQPQPQDEPELVYPESDGEPMSDNTLQAFWIIFLYNNLSALLPDFVAANLLWYPVRGNRKALAPDVLVAFGRPKGYRGSYKVWEEAGVQPQVAFEIRSPSNDDAEMAAKLADYDRYGVEEYYHYDPHRNVLEVFIRQDGRLSLMPVVGSFDSPLMGIRLLLRPNGLEILSPTGQPFRRFEEEQRRAEVAEERAGVAEERLRQARERAERLAARLRALGLDAEE